jgi:hypothetical protein
MNSVLAALAASSVFAMPAASLPLFPHANDWCPMVLCAGEPLIRPPNQSAASR